MKNSTLFHPRNWPGWAGVLILRLLTLLPLPLLYRVGWLAGYLISLLPLRRKAIIRANITLCFPQLTARQQQRMVCEVIVSSVYAVLETALSWWSSDARLLRHCSFEGSELMQAEPQRGILLLGLHLTTLDLAGRLFRLHFPVDVTYRQQNNAVINYQIEKYRARLFGRMIEKKDMRQLIRALKDGSTVWYAIDQNYGKTPFVFAPFFGHPAATLANLGRLSRMTGARPLLFSHYRHVKGWKVHYQLKVTDPFADGFTDDEQANAALLNSAYEAAIREHPEQYLWAHRRFKTRPDGMPSLYPKKKKRR